MRIFKEIEDNRDLIGEKCETYETDRKILGFRTRALVLIYLSAKTN